MEITTLSIPDLNTFRLDYVFNKPVLIIIAVIFFILYAIVTGVLKYHWNNYGMRNAGIIFAQGLFFMVSIVLFCLLGLTIYYF